MQNCKIYDTAITNNKNMAVQYLQDLEKTTSKPLNIQDSNSIPDTFWKWHIEPIFQAGLKVCYL